MTADNERSALSRRAFLGATVAAATGLVVASSGVGSAIAQVPSRQRLSPLVLSSDLYASDQLQRFIVALARGSAKGIEYVSGPAAQVRFRPPKGTAGRTWSEPVSASLDRAGLPRGRGVYVTTPVLNVPGVWSVEMKAARETVPFTIQVNEHATAPIVGQAAPRVASPTINDPLGVSPLCTRDPECPLHTESLATLIGSGKPVAVLFATPARCSSQYCGPVLDRLLDTMATYSDRIAFVHCEIYRAPTSTALVSTVATWNIPSEPWLFGIDDTGTITARLDGAFGGNEVKTLLDTLVT